MGHGYNFYCKKCNEKYQFFLGVGFDYPQVCRELLRDASKGKYGAEYQSILKSQEYAAINAEKSIYICSNCDKWEINYIMDLYVLKKPETMLDNSRGNHTIRDLEMRPYAMSDDLENDYRLVYRFPHTCSICGKPTHKATHSQIKKLRCPHCHTIMNMLEDIIDWD